MRVLFFLLLPLKLFSQDLEGVWTGTIYNDTTRKYIPYEIAISENKGKLSGFSHTIFSGENNMKETGIKSLKIRKKNDKILIEDDELVYNDYKEPPPKGVKQYSVLSLLSSDTGMILEGVFNTNRTREYSSLTGTLRLKKKEKIQESKLLPKLDELKLTGDLSFLKPEVKDVAVIPDRSKSTFEEKVLTNTVALKTQPVTKEIAQSTSPVITEKLPVEFKDEAVDYTVDVIKEQKSDNKIITKAPEKTITAKQEQQQVEQPKKEEPVFVLKEVKRTEGITGIKQTRQGPVINKKVNQKLYVTNINIKQMVVINRDSSITSKLPSDIALNNKPVKKSEVPANPEQSVKKQPVILPQQKPVVSTVQTIKPEIKQPAAKESNPVQTKQTVTTSPQNTAIAEQKQKIVTSIPEVKTKPVNEQTKNVVQKEFVQNVTKPQASLPLPQPSISAEDLAKRKIETIRSVEFKSDSLVLTLYDNGEVDGDIVSVILNGKVIMSKQMLTTQALTKTIHITPEMGDSLQLILYAENLGSIAPNTGLLIIKDAEDSYQIRFAGDLQKNAAIILRRKHN